MARGRGGPRATWTRVWPARAMSSRQHAASNGRRATPAVTFECKGCPSEGEPCLSELGSCPTVNGGKNGPNGKRRVWSQRRSDEVAKVPGEKRDSALHGSRMRKSVTRHTGGRSSNGGLDPRRWRTFRAERDDLELERDDDLFGPACHGSLADVEAERVNGAPRSSVDGGRQ